MSDLPLVSVCIPAYNAERTIRETLDSILRQDYPNFEVVVSDNQSADATRDIVESYADKGVRYCVHAAGRPDWAMAMPSYIGGFANWTYVLSQGRGEFLCLYHADDVYEPQIVRKQVTLMQTDPHVGAVFTMTRAIGEDGRPIRVGMQGLPQELRGRQVLDFDELFNTILAHGNFLPTPSVMMRRTVFESLGGFDERQFLTSADLELWLRIARHYKIGIIDELLLNYRVSQKQFGAQYNKLRTTLADFFGVLDHFLAQPEVRRVVKPDALALCEMNRVADQVLCAMNLLAQDKVAEARERLQQALQARHFVTALRRPRVLARLLVGACFWVSTFLGLGASLGRLVYRASQRRLQRRREPVG